MTASKVHAAALSSLLWLEKPTSCACCCDAQESKDGERHRAGRCRLAVERLAVIVDVFHHHQASSSNAHQHLGHGTWSSMQEKALPWAIAQNRMLVWLRACMAP